MKKIIFITIMILMVAVAPSISSSIFYPAMNGVLNQYGEVNSFGKIYFYEVGTYTEKDVYSDSSGSTIYPQPITLDGTGRANIWIDGIYRVYITDRNNNEIQDVSGVVSTEGLNNLDNINDIGDVSIAVAEGTIAYRDDSGNLVGLAPSTSGYVLKTNGAGAAPSWTNPSATPIALSDLIDVQLSGPSNGDFLKYVTGDSKWEDFTPVISDMSDVSFADSPRQGDVLFFDGSDWTRLEFGAAGMVLTTNGEADPTWELGVPSSPTPGDIIQFAPTGYQSLAIGTAGQVLTVNSGATLAEWSDLASEFNDLTDVNVSTTEGTVVYRNDAGDLVGLAPGNAGDTLVSGGAAAAPSWSSPGTPAGVVLPFAGSSAPTGYLLCDGSAVSRTTYSALFGVIDEVYGAGDTTTTFNLPDLRDRFIAGSGTSYSPGDTGGVNAVTLTAAQSGVPAHTHPTSILSYTTTIAGGVGTYPEITGTSATNTGNNIAQNASASHENRPPYLALNYIIKY